MNPLDRIYLDALEADGRRHEVPPRTRLLSSARTRRRPAPSTTPWAAPYASRVAAMDAVLMSLSDEEWAVEVIEGWTLQQLVAHLSAKDGLVADDIGAPVLGPPIGSRDPLDRTAEVQAAESTRMPEQTRESWRAQADALCLHLINVEPTTRTSPDGLPIPVSDAMLARALETWIHGDDAARASGYEMPAPVAAHVHPMADLCARLLPWALLAAGGDATGTVRVTMTGPGGGTWLIPLDIAHPVREDAPGNADAHITTDVVDLCFLLGGRTNPETLPAEISGDQALARVLLTAAPSLSGP
ncbi:maleylpyruvate isomerase family mycothiol-dependent enzyme [Actinomadura barringtoniae]|uniref:Maleylpyruvate isomerase family mycothiol-dependent enzyme n=1 Tax=Actinomadura barringtoniae TaxID=1427535 RepID=A0A939TDJ0_9ACTN|nr:maleylpyruvate isomerase family mycothiol-dependent enzyme [Actinomadura barringtoniae]MBO2455647.1 maleylpyruvate isomerase family mycothiol-dependent enzyme [Actinomadura barringtoniae]